VGFSAFRVNTADGALQGYACVGHDMTEKMDFTQRLAKANQELEGALLRLEKVHSDLKATQAQLVQSEKMRALGQMVAGVAHEINNPAAYVANNLLFLDEVLPKLQDLFDRYHRLKVYASPAEQLHLIELEQQVDLPNLWQDLQEVVRDNRLGMERITTIVRSLRNFAQTDMGVMRSADLNEGLRSTLNIVRPLFQDRIVILTAFADLPEVEGYPGELNQVFLNLLMNACQAITQHGTVSVSTQPVVGGVQVDIRDSGCGMDEVTLARLGEPFFTTKDVGQGTGLGLAISFAIIEKHHGKITYESHPGQGTTVRVEIPARAQ
jgi:signal transduction histidine kinase